MARKNTVVTFLNSLKMVRVSMQGKHFDSHNYGTQ